MVKVCVLFNLNIYITRFIKYENNLIYMNTLNNVIIFLNIFYYMFSQNIVFHLFFLV